jgi:hypothetical protein
MEREIGIDDRAKNAPEGGLEDGGWLVNIVPVWKDIDMANSCPKVAEGRNHVCAALTL